MTYRCFQNSKLINGIYENGKTISRVYQNGQLVWEKYRKRDGIVTIYAKDGTIVKYKDSEVGQEPLSYADSPFFQWLSDFSMLHYDTYVNHIGVLSAKIDYDDETISVIQPYISNPHLSTLSASYDEEAETLSIDSQFLSVIANDTNLSSIPPFGYIMCYDLRYIESNSVKVIGPCAFGFIGGL